MKCSLYFRVLIFWTLAAVYGHAMAQTQARLSWARGMGGNGWDATGNVAIDKAGNVYTTGVYTYQADFDPGTGTYTLNGASPYFDIFISKLDAKGNFVWAKSIGEYFDDYGWDIAIDKQGNIYIACNFSGTVDFDPGSGVNKLTEKSKASGGGTGNPAILKLNKNGDFLWAKQFSGISMEGISRMVIDDSGFVYTAGYFQDTVDFDPGSGKFSLYASKQDCFISKLDSDGNFVWAKQLGTFTSSYFWTYDISITDSGFIYVGGSFSGTGDFDPGSGACNFTCTGVENGFITKLSASGNFVWAKQLKNNLYCTALVTDNAGSVYATGRFYNASNDFDPGSGTYMLNSFGGEDIFVAKLNAAGNFVWAKQLGGLGEDDAWSITADSAAGIYITGSFSDTADFDPGKGKYSLICGNWRKGFGDIYIAKLDSSGNFSWAYAMSGNSYAQGGCIKTDSLDNVYLTGAYTGKVDFDPGKKTEYLTSAGNHDVIICKLRQCKISDTTLTIKACNSYKAPSGKIFTSSGNYSDTIQNAVGCDSVITLLLTIDKSTSATITVAACQTYLSPSKKYKWSKNGTYKDTIANKKGCDSVITIQLSIGTKSSAGIISPFACKVYQSPSKKYQWTVSGTYSDTIPNKSGCDSVITIKLNVSSSQTFSYISPKACKTYTSPSKRYKWTKSGSYTDTIKSKFGCDSIITIQLTVGTLSTSSNITAKGCKTYISPSKKRIWSASGTYKDTIQNAKGCDSIMTITLTINNNTTASISPSACHSYISPSKKNVWTSTGLYKDTISNKTGCDSIITINLTINSSSFGSISSVACNRYLSPSRKYVWSNDGTYLDTIRNKKGCDSVITIQLSLNKKDISVINNAPKLTSKATVVSYQWLDCNKSYQPLSGANGQDYTATKNGFYAVAIAWDNCRDTSECYKVDNVGLNHPGNANKIHFFPNPTSGRIQFEMPDNYSQINITVTNILGETVIKKEFSDSSFILDIDKEIGVYIIYLSSSEGWTAVYKVVKK